jgi:hypothetical protein
MSCRKSETELSLRHEQFFLSRAKSLVSRWDGSLAATKAVGKNVSAFIRVTH